MGQDVHFVPFFRERRKDMLLELGGSFRRLAAEFASYYGSEEQLAALGRQWLDELRPRMDRAVGDARAAADLAVAMVVAPVYIGVGAAVSVVRPAGEFAIAVVGALIETACMVCRPSAPAPRRR